MIAWKRGEHAWNEKGSALRIDVKSAIPARSQVLLALAAHKCCLLCHFYPIASIFANLYIYIYCIYLYIYTRIIITIQTFIYCVVLHTSIWNKEPFFNIIQHATEICRNHNDLGKLLRSQAWIVITVPNCGCYVHMAVCQNLVPLVNIKIAGKWCSSH